jgi:hypothetical protein
MIIHLDAIIFTNLALFLSSCIDYFGLAILVLLVVKPYLWDEHGGDL